MRVQRKVKETKDAEDQKSIIRKAHLYYHKSVGLGYEQMARKNAFIFF